MFTNNALAKHEVNRSWKPGKDGIEMVTKDEFDEIIKVPVSLNALNNFRCIYQKIWPLDTSVDALFNVTWRQLGSSAYPPTAGDISELFAYWIQDRAQAAVEGRPPQTFVNLSSHNLSEATAIRKREQHIFGKGFEPDREAQTRL